MNSPHGLICFSTRSYDYLAEAICKDAGFERGEVEARAFPDGEHYLRIRTDVDGRDVALIGGTVSDADTLALYDLGGALVEQGARSLTILCPYFGYSTMERAVRPGEVVTAKARARLFSSLPLAHFGNRMLLVDLHTEGIPYYFESPMRTVHVYAKPVIGAAVRRLGGNDFVLACTDAGRAKWVESLANDIGVPASFVFKRRLSGDKTQVTAVSAQVQGKRVVIYDDMIRTGGSLMGAAKAYRDAGASSVAAVATHGLFPGDALERLRQSGLFTEIVCTDTHPRARQLEDGFLVVESVAGLLARYLAEHGISAA